MDTNTCCFTGHRPQSLPWRFNETDPRCQLLQHRMESEIRSLISEHHVRHFVSGMALGVDTWAAEIVLQLRDTEHLPITLECAIPCEEQAVQWTEDDRDRYFSIVQRRDRETMLQTHYMPDCFHKRDRYMVDHSQFVIAVWNGTAAPCSTRSSASKPSFPASARPGVAIPVYLSVGALPCPVYFLFLMVVDLFAVAP